MRMVAGRLPRLLAGGLGLTLEVLTYDHTDRIKIMPDSL